MLLIDGGGGGGGAPSETLEPVPRLISIAASTAGTLAYTNNNITWHGMKHGTVCMALSPPQTSQRSGRYEKMRRSLELIAQCDIKGMQPSLQHLHSIPCNTVYGMQRIALVAGMYEHV